MEIITFFWHYYLYVPLFNFLVWLYLNFSNYNFGVTIIILTVLLRIILLPFSILTEKGKFTAEELRKEVMQINRDFAGDPVRKKIAIRQAMKKKKIRPWAKTIALAAQGLVLFLLYQVFIGGINTQEKLHQIYPFIQAPDFINTSFLWMNLAIRDFFISFLVGIYLFAGIVFERRIHNYKPSRKEQIFSLFFPIFCFVLLYYLPSAKSLFVLTSMIFSSIITLISFLIKFSIKKAALASQD